jgi:hypothetical protein
LHGVDFKKGAFLRAAKTRCSVGDFSTLPGLEGMGATNAWQVCAAQTVTKTRFGQQRSAQNSTKEHKVAQSS